MADDHNPTFDDYSPNDHERVRQTCLHLATVLGALTDELTIVGGLVPSLLVPDKLEPDFEPHRGTMDLDLGLSVAVLAEDLYATIAAQLRMAGFEVDVNEKGNTTFYRWRTPPDTPKVTVDFLIAEEALTTLHRVAKFDDDFGALATRGLQLAWRDRRKVTLDGYTLHGMRAIRDVWICGPGAFVILKARAIQGREKFKDAYDLYYLLKHYGTGLADVAAAILPLLDDPDAHEAIQWLARNFADADCLGPKRTALFRYGHEDADLEADALGLVQALLRLVE